MNRHTPSICILGPLCAWLLLAAVQGCLPFTSPRVELPDLSTYPQNASVYARQTPDWTADPKERERRKHSFVQKYFRPWHSDQPIHSRAKLFWPLHAVGRQQYFAENTRPRSRQWLDALRDKADPEAFPSESQCGIALTNTDLRALPTRKPAFHDFQHAGQGYPFDTFQNSALWAGTPVHIVHATKSRDWLLVETDWIFGWVPGRDIGLVDADFIEAFQSTDLIAFVQDQTAVIDQQGIFRFTGHIGGLLPLVHHQNRSAEVLVPVTGTDRQAHLRTALLKPGVWTDFPMPVTGRNLARVADALLGQTYGWGGLYENRDCSALTRDLYTPFAIWLPRNSAQQAQVPRTISLDHLRAREKERRILEQGLPFLTLISMPGHIMIYIGALNNRPLVMHAMWGLKTWSPFHGEGRYVVGQSVITSLSPGQGLPAPLQPRIALIERIQGMSVLVPGVND